MTAAPAKVNLSLHVTGRRDDGYHLLDSLVVFTEFGDRLTIARGDDASLSLSGPYASCIHDTPADDNLALRAARAMAQHFHQSGGWRVALEKHIPVGAGLGGGSADAGAVIRTLAAQWHRLVDEAAIQLLALSLGADVPACIHSRSLYMRGIGEQITPAPGLPQLALLLVNHGESLATGQVFAALNGERTSPLPVWQGGGFDDFIAYLSHCRNDLQEAAIGLCPTVAHVLACLERLPQCRLARMSGSGATCFGIFETLGQAQQAAQQLAQEKPAWWNIATRVIS